MQKVDEVKVFGVVNECTCDLTPVRGCCCLNIVIIILSVMFDSLDSYIHFEPFKKSSEEPIVTVI